MPTDTQLKQLVVNKLTEEKFNALLSADEISENEWYAVIDSSKGVSGDIGDIKYTIKTTPPVGGVWCDGAEYTQEEFPEVYQMLVDGVLSSTDIETFNTTVASNGSYGRFGLDTTNQKFRVPCLNEVYIKAEFAPYGYRSQGIPNITGSITLHSSQNANIVSRSSSMGAFAGSGGSADSYKSPVDLQEHTNSSSWGNVSFNASRSSAAYKSVDKVNPDHVAYRAYIVLYTQAVPASTAQTAEFVQSLSSKADISLNNLSSTGKTAIATASLPSHSVSTIALAASGTTYTMPANGYLCFTRAATAANQYLNLFNQENEMGTMVFAPAADYVLRVCLPVQKGDKVSASYTAGSSGKFFLVKCVKEV